MPRPLSIATKGRVIDIWPTWSDVPPPIRDLMFHEWAVNYSLRVANLTVMLILAFTSN